MQLHDLSRRIDKYLNLFTEVKPKEGVNSLLLGFGLFLLLTAYYIMKPVREALILSTSGAEIKSYASVLQLILLIGLVPLYAKCVGRLSRVKLINVVTLFFTVCLLLFYLLAQLQVPYLGIAFFIWVGVFNMVVIAQYWSYANDIHSPEEGKRLFAIILFGANIGAITGSLIAGKLVAAMGVYPLLLVAAMLLICSLLVTNFVETRKRSVNQPPPEGLIDGRSLRELPDAFRLVFSNRYMLLIGCMLFLLNFVNTTGEFIFGKMISAHAKEMVAAGLTSLSVGQVIGKFYADFFSWVNICTMAIQLFLVSRIFRFFGLRVATLIVPVIAFGGYALMAFFPVLAIVRIAKIFENSTDYSLQNTVRHALFLPTRREDKYKAKQVTDGVFWRLGDVFSALLVFVGSSYWSFSVGQYALVNAIIVAFWFGVSIYLGREFTRRTSSKPQQQRIIPVVVNESVA